MYPLADTLVAENIPFVFVTGYGADELEARFANVPVLQKPIELNALQSIFGRPVGYPAMAEPVVPLNQAAG